MKKAQEEEKILKKLPIHFVGRSILFLTDRRIIVEYVPLRKRMKEELIQAVYAIPTAIMAGISGAIVIFGIIILIGLFVPGKHPAILNHPAFIIGIVLFLLFSVLMMRLFYKKKKRLFERLVKEDQRIPAQISTKGRKSFEISYDEVQKIVFHKSDWTDRLEFLSKKVSHCVYLSDADIWKDISSCLLSIIPGKLEEK